MREHPGAKWERGEQAALPREAACDALDTALMVALAEPAMRA